MLEPVSRSRCLGCHVTAVVGVDRRLKRHPADNFDASLCEASELGGIVGEQRYSCAVQHSQHARGDAGTASVKSGLPTMMATGLPPMASRNTTKGVVVPELRGTEASLAIINERIASLAKRATASASTLTMIPSHTAGRAYISAASTAGSPCDNLTN